MRPVRAGGDRGQASGAWLTSLTLSFVSTCDGQAPSQGLRQHWNNAHKTPTGPPPTQGHGGERQGTGRSHCGGGGNDGTPAGGGPLHVGVSGRQGRTETGDGEAASAPRGEGRSRSPSRYRWGTEGWRYAAAMSGFHSRRCSTNTAIPVTSLLSSRASSSPNTVWKATRAPVSGGLPLRSKGTRPEGTRGLLGPGRVAPRTQPGGTGVCRAPLQTGPARLVRL